MRKHTILIFFVFLCLVFGACKPKSAHPGYTKSRKGFHYQLHTFGESDIKAKIGDYVTLDIQYTTLTDSIFFEGRRKLKMEPPIYDGAIEDCIMLLHSGESATFILDASPFFKQTLGSDLPSFMKPGDKIKIKTSIIEIQTAREYENEKIAFLNWIEDFGDYEKVILKQFLTSSKPGVNPLKSGLIHLPIVKNDAPRIQVGDTITINYEGKFLNGKFFDSTKRRNLPFQFIYGTEWQVIKGLEEGLGLMGKGESALFILPSELAFGKSGSSTGIIPPFTSLIFEVDIVDVIKGPSLQ